jgi:MGT family glycosyltransferase
MRHIGAICDPDPSHVMAMASICRELQARGHRVTLFQFPSVMDPASADGLTFWPFKSPESHLNWSHNPKVLKEHYGVAPIDFLRRTTGRARFVCEHAAAELAAANLDCMLVDAADPGAATVAEKMGLPFVTICNALPVSSDPLIPPDFLPWNYHLASWARWRNSITYAVRDLILYPLFRTLNQYRKKWGLLRYKTPTDSLSPYARITQLIPEFDFPRKHLPLSFHYAGPYRREKATQSGFAYEMLNGRPLIYASLGTIVGDRPKVWHTIAEACAGLDAQLVIALGTRGRSIKMGPLPGEPIVLDYAPQRELLARASLFITHAGLNSAMEALAGGVPMVAIPILGDQFGVAARIAYCGAGQAVSLPRCDRGRLRDTVAAVLEGESYRRRALELQGAVNRTGGASRAAEIVETVAETGRPVYREIGAIATGTGGVQGKSSAPATS